MSGSADSRDFDAALKAIEDGLLRGPDITNLRMMRELLDDVAFIPELRAYIARNRNMLGLTEVPNTITRLMRVAEERREGRKSEKEWVMQLGSAGGIALVGGSVLAALSLAAPLVALIPAAGGIWMGTMAYWGGRRLDRERVLYEQIAGRLAEIVEATKDDK